MDTQILTDALRGLDTASFEWKFALYSKNKGRDGLELDWNLCGMQGIDEQTNKLREFLLKKPVAEKLVGPYSPFLSDKENIFAVSLEDEMLREQVSDILLSIQRGTYYSPEDFVTGVLPRPVGYAFYGENGEANEQILFMRRGNPFLTGSAAQLYTASGDEVAPCGQPVLRFASAVDFLVIGDACYILSNSVGKDLALEDRHFAIAAKRLESLVEADIISDMELLEKAAYTSKNARKFEDFDKAVLEHIVNMAVNAREDFLLTYGVTITADGKMDTRDPEQCELIIDLLCCRSCIDPLGRLAVGKDITPRE